MIRPCQTGLMIMNKPQVTTTGGVAGLVASIQSIAGLFGGYNIGQSVQAVLSMPIGDVVLSVCGLVVSVWAILHNEDKKKCEKQ